MAASIRSGICALYWFVIAFVIASFLSVPVQASVLHFLNSFRCVCADFVNSFWILRETFLRPEKKTSILTHIAVYERSGLGHRK